MSTEDGAAAAKEKSSGALVGWLGGADSDWTGWLSGREGAGTKAQLTSESILILKLFVRKTEALRTPKKMRLPGWSGAAAGAFVLSVTTVFVVPTEPMIA